MCLKLLYILLRIFFFSLWPGRFSGISAGPVYPGENWCLCAAVRNCSNLFTSSVGRRRRGCMERRRRRRGAQGVCNTLLFFFFISFSFPLVFNLMWLSGGLRMKLAWRGDQQHHLIGRWSDWHPQGGTRWVNCLFLHNILHWPDGMCFGIYLLSYCMMWSVISNATHHIYRNTVTHYSIYFIWVGCFFVFVFLIRDMNSSCLSITFYSTHICLFVILTLLFLMFFFSH